MSTKRWTVELEGRSHEVVLEHGYFSARRRITVDGAEVLDQRPRGFGAVRLWNTATEHPIVIAGHDCAVRIDPTIDNVSYMKFLIVDGRDVDSGKPMPPLPVTATGARESEWLGKGGAKRFLISMVGVVVVVSLLEVCRRL